jgi:tetratricopeptide (TPR) repeat protein
LPLLALALGCSIVTLRAQIHGEAAASLEAIPLDARIWNALLAYVGYMGKMLWPTDLAVFYPHPGQTVSVVQAIGAGVLLLLVTILVIGPGRRWPYLTVGWFWYLGTLVPVIGLVQVGSQAMADRYTYIPLIGLFLLLTWGVADLALAWRLSRSYLVAAAALLLSACAALTWHQVSYWQSDGDLWEHALSVTSRNAIAHNKLGMHYHRQGKLPRAEKELEKAVTVDPTLLVYRYNHAAVLQELGRLHEALAEYQRANTLNPDVAWAHTNMGNLLRTLGRLNEALAEYARSIALNPDESIPHYNLGVVQVELGRLGDAVDEYRRAVALDAASAPSHLGLAAALADLGHCEEAATEYRRAIDLNPRDAFAHARFGQFLQAEGRLEEALSEYRRAVELSDKQALALLRICERLSTLQARLPAVIAGRDHPASNEERLAFAELCRQRTERRYLLAARLYKEAFTADSRLGEDLATAYRFHAASAAAAAGCGQGQDAAQLEETEKLTLRNRALNWLQSDLDLWTNQAQSRAPQTRAAVRHALHSWLRDPGLSGIRDPVALAKLPTEECEAWQRLWRQVDILVAKVST